MDIREYLIDILLTIVMIISTLVLILRFWQDLTIAIAAVLMMLSLGGLFLSLQIKVRRLEQSVISRERMLRTNLEEISTGWHRNTIWRSRTLTSWSPKCPNGHTSNPVFSFSRDGETMGVALRDIIADYKTPVEWESLGGVAAVDANNTLYQFLTIIRQPDGTPLMDRNGRVTSHLSGILFRISEFFRERNKTGLCVRRRANGFKAGND